MRFVCRVKLFIALLHDDTVFFDKKIVACDFVLNDVKQAN